MDEPKEGQEVVKDFDTLAAEVLDAPKPVEETPEDSSSSEETKPEETKDSEEVGADQPEKATEETEETEGEDPSDLAFRKKWNKAKAKLETEHETKVKELESKVLTNEQQQQIEDFKRITSSPEYVRLSMKEQGFKDETINSKLKELGHEVKELPTDDLRLIFDKLNISPDTIDENTKATLTDIAKIFNVLYEDRTGKMLPKYLEPIQAKLAKQESMETASTMIKGMQSTVNEEGVLDFKADLEPKLNTWLDENPKASQEEFEKYFGQLNHKLTIERLTLKGKKQGRDEKRMGLKGNKEGISITPGNKPERTGNFDKDFDAMADAIGVH